MPSIKNRVLLISVLAVFLDMVSFGILVPIFPLLVLEPSNPLFIFRTEVSSNTRYILLGLIVGLYPLAQLVSTPILGQLSDIRGRKPILTLSFTGTVLAYILIIIGISTRNLGLLFLARAIDGASGGNISVAQAAIADVSTEKTRSRNFGLLGAAFGLGFILGPLIGAKFSVGLPFMIFGLTAPYWFALVFSAVNIIILTTVFPETKVNRKVTAISWGKAFLHLLEALRVKKIRVLFGINFLYYASFSFLTSFISLFLISRFNVPTSSIGVFISFVGLWVALSQIFFVKSFIKIFKSEERALLGSLIISSVGLLCMFLSPTLSVLYTVTPIFAACMGLSQAYILSLVSKYAEGRQGEVLGINTSVTALAHAIPPILSGFGAALFSPGTPILFAFFAISVASCFYWWYLSSRKMLKIVAI